MLSIRIDNSEYMRNGDYAPNRFGAQTDAVTVVFSHKVDTNPENTAGVMTMAGKRQVYSNFQSPGWMVNV